MVGRTLDFLAVSLTAAAIVLGVAYAPRGLAVAMIVGVSYVVAHREGGTR